MQTGTSSRKNHATRRVAVALLANTVIMCGPPLPAGPVREFVTQEAAGPVFNNHTLQAGAGTTDGKRFFTASLLLGVARWERDGSGAWRKTDLGAVDGTPGEVRVVGGRLFVLTSEWGATTTSALHVFPAESNAPSIPIRIPFNGEVLLWEATEDHLDVAYTTSGEYTGFQYRRLGFTQQGTAYEMLSWAADNCFIRWLRDGLLGCSWAEETRITELGENTTSHRVDWVVPGSPQYAGFHKLVGMERTAPRDPDAGYRSTVRELRPGGVAQVVMERVVFAQGDIFRVFDGAMTLAPEDGTNQLLDLREPGAPRVVTQGTGLMLVGVLGDRAIVSDDSLVARALPLDGGDAVTLGNIGSLYDAYPAGPRAMMIGIDGDRFRAVVLKQDGTLTSREVKRRYVTPVAGDDDTLWLDGVSIQRELSGDPATEEIDGAPLKERLRVQPWGRAWLQRGAHGRARVMVDRGMGPAELSPAPEGDVVDIRGMPSGLMVITSGGGRSRVVAWRPSADGTTLEDTGRALDLEHDWPIMVLPAGDQRWVLIGAHDDGQVQTCGACADCYFSAPSAIRLLDFTGEGAPRHGTLVDKTVNTWAMGPLSITAGNRLFMNAGNSTLEFDVGVLPPRRVGSHDPYVAVSTDGHAMTFTRQVVRIGDAGTPAETLWTVPNTSFSILLDGTRAFSVDPSNMLQRHEHLGAGEVRTQNIRPNNGVGVLSWDWVMERDTATQRLLRIAEDGTSTEAWRAHAALPVSTWVDGDTVWVATPSEVLQVR